ncbi:MAG: hypothetical protein WCK67_01000 [bacterium]
MKKIISSILILSIILLNTTTAYALSTEEVAKASDSKIKTIEGKIEENNEIDKKKNIFTGQTQEIKQGTAIKMTVTSVLSSTVNQEGDEFFAEVTNDLDAPGGVAIPQGTIAHGKITKVRNAKRLGRDAYISLNFDYLVTPDGREIPVNAEMSTKHHAVTSVAKVALEDTAYTMAGGVIGGIFALKLFGIGGAIASNGYTVAGGAGLGAAVGVTVSLVRKGSDKLISPGDEIKVKMDSGIKVPILTEESLRQDETKLDGLKVAITNCQLEKDPFGEPNTITLSLNIDNKTENTFSSFDIALVNDYKSVFYASPFSNTDMWFTKIAPNTKLNGKLSFSVDNPKRKHWLVFYDSMTRKPLAKISIDNAQKDLRKKKASK